jgi:amidase
MGMLGQAVGRKQVLLTDLFEKKNLPYTQGTFDKVSGIFRSHLFIGQTS